MTPLLSLPRAAARICQVDVMEGAERVLGVRDPRAERGPGELWGELKCLLTVWLHKTHPARPAQ